MDANFGIVLDDPSLELNFADQPEWKQTIACYSVFGSDKSQAGEVLQCTSFEGWRNAVMSPRVAHYLNPKLIAKEALSRFSSCTDLRQFDRKFAYFNVRLPQGKEIPGKFLSEMESLGFYNNSKSTVVLFRDVMKIALPKGMVFASGSIVNSQRLRQHFLEIMKDAFIQKSKEKFTLFWNEILLAIPKATGTTRVVIIYTARGKPAAAGLVTSTSSGAFLWCGGVKTLYRSQGLSKALIAIRQVLSQQDGCNRWSYSTSNARMKVRGDLHYDEYYFSTER